MTNAKVTIPNEVADAIESFRAGRVPWNNERILHLRSNETYDSPSAKALRSIPFDTLLSALVNGYEREKTAEEQAHERIRGTYASRLSLGRLHPLVYGHTSFANGIKYALNELGVKIEGVNA